MADATASEFFTQTFGNTESPLANFYVVRLYRDHIEIDYQGIPMDIEAVTEEYDEFVSRSLRVIFSYNHQHAVDVTRRYTKIATIKFGLVLFVKDVNDHSDRFVNRYYYTSGDILPAWAVRDTTPKRSLRVRLLDKAIELALRLPDGHRNRWH